MWNRLALTFVTSVGVGGSVGSGSHEAQSACCDDPGDAREVESVAIVLPRNTDCKIFLH